MSKPTSASHKLKEEEQHDNQLDLNQLTVPIYVAHVKPGNTLCANDDTLIIQDGSTTLEIRTPPKFEPKKVPWRDGLIRDIVWCHELNVFILLTQKSLFSINPNLLIAPPTTVINTDLQLKITSYSKIKPCDEKYSFWRCTCVGTTLYISYSGLATIIDEYNIGPSSCELVTRWTPPQTCANHEGIWCIRYHPTIDQLGMTIMSAQSNQWHFEIRSRKDLSPVWQTVLPLTHGDCELSPLAHGEWLTVNSCGIRLVHIADHKLKAAVEYERELKNAITIGNHFIVVRTKNTIEIHPIKKKEN